MPGSSYLPSKNAATVPSVLLGQQLISHLPQKPQVSAGQATAPQFIALSTYQDIGIIAAVDEAQVYHHRARMTLASGQVAILPLVLQVHDVLHVRKAKGLAVGNILGGKVAAPGPDGPVHTGFLHVHASGEQPGPGGRHQLRLMHLPFQVLNLRADVWIIL